MDARQIQLYVSIAIAITLFLLSLYAFDTFRGIERNLKYLSNYPILTLDGGFKENPVLRGIEIAKLLKRYTRIMIALMTVFIIMFFAINMFHEYSLKVPQKTELGGK